MVLNRIGTDNNYDLCLRNISHLIGYSTRPYSFQQSCNGRCVTQSGAMINVIAAKAGADQFLKQVSLFVTAFGRSKSGERIWAVL